MHSQANSVRYKTRAMKKYYHLLSIIAFSFIMMGSSGNIDKRFRPETDPIKKWEDVEPQVQYVCQYVRIALNRECALHGSWMNRNWWFNSDIDLVFFDEQLSEEEIWKIEKISKLLKVKIETRVQDSKLTKFPYIKVKLD